MEPNHPLAYNPGLELHRLIMSTLRDAGGWLYRETEIDTTHESVHFFNQIKGNITRSGTIDTKYKFS